MSKMSTIKLSLVAILSFSTFIGCGDKYNAEEVGSEDFKLAASLAPDAEEVERFEKMSTDVRTPPSINRIYKVDNTKINIRIYKGRQRDGVRFKRFNLSIDGRYFATVKHCTSSKRYCNVHVGTKYLKAGRTYKFTVSGIDRAGDWTSISGPKPYTMDGTPASSSSPKPYMVGKIFKFDGLYFRVLNSKGATCRVHHSIAKKYTVHANKPSFVDKVNYQARCNY